MEVMREKSNKGARVTNFGGNISFIPRHAYTPRDEDEVLEILNKHSRDKVRVVASLHSWSDVCVCEDVVINMRNFDTVDIEEKDGEVWVTAGAGIIIQRLLDTIHKKTNSTLPSLGAVKRQTISGAISTGTHGSGKNSLSHYMDEIRIAAFDPETGKAKIYDWSQGQELRAARCSLGCMGVILAVTFKCVSKYYVAETVVRADSLKEVLSEEETYPLQQFAFFPYAWSYFAYRRKVVDEKPRGIRKIITHIYRLYNFKSVDVGSHLLLKIFLGLIAVKVLKPSFFRWFYKNVSLALMLTGHTVVDDSEHALTLNHHFFKHLEMEVFIPKKNIHEALELIQCATLVFSGSADALPEKSSSRA